MRGKISKIILVLAFFTVLAGIFCINIPNVEAYTIEELKVMIAELQAQIAALQQQLAELQGEETEWCHDFEVNLGCGDGGSEVEALQIALEKEGLYEKGDNPPYFDKNLVSSVIDFQERYAEDILTSWGLEHGTGYAGATTRAKLNELYGCPKEVSQEELLANPWLRKIPEITSVSDEIIIGYKSDVPNEKKQGIRKLHNLEKIKSIPQLNVETVKVSVEARDRVIQTLKENPDIEYAEPDYIAYPTYEPNDPYYLDGTQWAPQKIQAPQAWDISKGDSDVVVAVIDSGADPDHPDLADKLVTGYNFLDDSTDTADDYGHGTHCAGIVAAATDNGTGIASTGFDTKIMPLKVYNKYASAWYSQIAHAIIYAADHEAKVISISLGNYPSSDYLRYAVDYAWDAGCVVVSSAGNNNKSDPFHPAAYENVIGVAATDQNDVKASWSNYGSYISVAAPGVSIYSTYWSDGSTYVRMSGTSMSTPCVAGLAGLLFAQDGGRTNAEVRSLIEENADDLGDPGWDEYYGWGRINAYNSLEAGRPPDTTPPTTEIASPAQDDTVFGTIDIEAEASDDRGVTKMEFFINDELLASDLTEPYTATWETTEYEDGSYTLTTKAYDEALNVGESTPIDVNVDNTGTAVFLTSFTAESVEGDILLEWETAQEIDNIGFNIYRSLGSDFEEAAKINETLIPSKAPGQITGATYEYLDETVEQGVIYYYWLEDVDTSGLSTQHGPIDVQNGQPPATHDDKYYDIARTTKEECLEWWDDVGRTQYHSLDEWTNGQGYDWHCKKWDAENNEWVDYGGYKNQCWYNKPPHRSYDHIGCVAYGKFLTEEPSITILSPNGREEWSIGSAHNITWESEGIDKINIWLVDESQKIAECTTDGVCCYHCSNWELIASEISASSGQYLWTVSSNEEPDSQYLIKTRGVSDNCFEADGCPSDESDDYFSIIESQAHDSQYHNIARTTKQECLEWWDDVGHTQYHSLDEWTNGRGYDWHCKKWDAENNEWVDYGGYKNQCWYNKPPHRSYDHIGCVAYGKFLTEDNVTLIKNQLASVSSITSQMLERIKELMGK